MSSKLGFITIDGISKTISAWNERHKKGEKSEMEEKGTRKEKGENTGSNDYKLGKNEGRENNGQKD